MEPGSSVSVSLLDTCRSRQVVFAEDESGKKDLGWFVSEVGKNEGGRDLVFSKAESGKRRKTYRCSCSSEICMQNAQARVARMIKREAARAATAENHVEHEQHVQTSEVEAGVDQGDTIPDPDGSIDNGIQALLDFAEQEQEVPENVGDGANVDGMMLPPDDEDLKDQKAAASTARAQQYEGLSATSTKSDVQQYVLGRKPEGGFCNRKLVFHLHNVPGGGKMWELDQESFALKHNTMCPAKPRMTTEKIRRSLVFSSMMTKDGAVRPGNKMSIAAMQSTMATDGARLPKSTASIARRRMTTDVKRESETADFGRMPPYSRRIVAVNPGSVIAVKTFCILPDGSTQTRVRVFASRREQKQEVWATSPIFYDPYPESEPPISLRHLVDNLEQLHEERTTYIFDDAVRPRFAGYKAFDEATPETFVSICVVPGPAVEIASRAAYSTVFVDGAHMKDAQGSSAYDNAQILIVEMKTSVFEIQSKKLVTKNLPLGVSVCLSESLDNYAFLYWAIGLAGFNLNSPHISVVSDRGRAVISAGEHILPLAAKFFCNVHLWRNLVAEVREKIEEKAMHLFFSLTKSSSRRAQDTYWDELMKVLPERGQDYLREIDQATFIANAFRERHGRAIGFYNTNPVEAENYLMMDARWTHSPLHALQHCLEEWGKRIAKIQRIVKQADEMRNPDEPRDIIFPPLIHLIRQPDMVAPARTWRVEEADAINQQYRVQMTPNHFFNVDLRLRECDCGLYQERQYPCQHALAVHLNFEKAPPFGSMFSPIFRLDNMMEAFKRSIKVLDRELCGVSQRETIKPPIHFEPPPPRTRGRPSKQARRPSVGEHLAAPKRRRASAAASAAEQT